MKKRYVKNKKIQNMNDNDTLRIIKQFEKLTKKQQLFMWLESGSAGFIRLQINLENIILS